MKILGEANNQALAKNNPINEVLLRGDPKIFLMPSSKLFLIKFFILSALRFTSILNLTINNNELIKITSQ
jgi:hypothetical protein